MSHNTHSLWLWSLVICGNTSSLRQMKLSSVIMKGMDFELFDPTDWYFIYPLGHIRVYSSSLVIIKNNSSHVFKYQLWQSTAAVKLYHTVVGYLQPLSRSITKAKRWLMCILLLWGSWLRSEVMRRYKQFTQQHHPPESTTTASGPSPSSAYPPARSLALPQPGNK